MKSNHEATRRMVEAVSELGIDYMLAGSYSSNYYGIPLATKDADFVAVLGSNLSQLEQKLGQDFERNPQRSFETETGTFRETWRIPSIPFKIELFHLSEDLHDQARFSRRVKLWDEILGCEVSLPTVEDVIIMKLRWSKLTGRARDVEDVRDILAVQGEETLDWTYLDQLCEAWNVQSARQHSRVDSPSRLDLRSRQSQEFPLARLWWVPRIGIIMRTSITLISLSALILTHAAFAEDAKPAETKPAEPKPEVKSVFPDKALEDAVRKQVFAKRNNGEPLTADDVKDVSTVTGIKLGIKSLEGMQHCLSLAELRLSENMISDIAPLKDLKRLQSLSLENNVIQDISTVATLPALQYLNLEYNQVRDITPVKGLVKLNSLYLASNKVEDISVLKDLKKLWSLYLGNNQVRNIDVVAELPWLTSLELKANGLEKVDGLSKIKEVRFLDLRENRISDLSPLITACEADAKGDTKFAPFLRLYLKGNTDLEVEAAKPQLEKLKGIGVRIEG